MVGKCKNCEKSIVSWRMKEREYCSDACRIAAWRKRKDQEKRDQREKEQVQLLADLERLQLPPEVKGPLMELLFLEENERGLRIVQLVTKAIEHHLQFVQKMTQKPWQKKQQ